MPLIVKVPSHCAPGIQLHLFSPQDYAHCHKQPADLASVLGSHAWFAFIHEASTEKKPLIILSNIDPASHLFLVCTDSKPLSETPHKGKEECPVHGAHVILDNDNANLSATQEVLPLDHQQLGHVHMNLV